MASNVLKYGFAVKLHSSSELSLQASRLVDYIELETHRKTTLKKKGILTLTITLYQL